MNDLSVTLLSASGVIKIYTVANFWCHDGRWELWLADRGAPDVRIRGQVGQPLDPLVEELAWGLAAHLSSIGEEFWDALSYKAYCPTTGKLTERFLRR